MYKHIFEFHLLWKDCRILKVENDLSFRFQHCCFWDTVVSQKPEVFYFIFNYSINMVILINHSLQSTCLPFMRLYANFLLSCGWIPPSCWGNWKSLKLQWLWKNPKFDALAFEQIHSQGILVKEKRKEKHKTRNFNKFDYTKLTTNWKTKGLMNNF